MKVSDNIDVELLNNVSKTLKPVLKQLLSYIDTEQEKTNSFTERQINRMITELNSGILNIHLGTSDELAIEYDKNFKENPYLKGYYRCNSKGKIIVINSADQQQMLGVLSHEWEHFLVDEIPMEERDKYTEKENKLWVDVNDDEENLIYNTEFNVTEKKNSAGGFTGDYTNKSWLEMWDEAATEIIACDRVNQSAVGYQKRIDFVNVVLRVNGLTIKDLRNAYRQGDLNFIYGLMPKSKLLNISKLEAQLSDSSEATELIGMDNNVYSRSIMDNEILDYFLEIKNTDQYKAMSDKEKTETFLTLSNLKYTHGNKQNNEMVAYNKVDFKTQEFLSIEKNTSVDSRELIAKLDDWFKEQELSDTIEKLPRVKLIYLRGIAYARQSFGDDTKQIDEICGEFENRLIHQEKLKLNADGVLKNSAGKKMKEEYIRFDKIEKHFIYKNGKRYLNSLIEANDMKIKIYDVNMDNMSIVTILENGLNSESIEQKYEHENEFGFKLNQIVNRLKSNKISVFEFKSANQQEMDELYAEGFKIAKEHQTKQQNKQTTSNNFISSLKSKVVPTVSLIANIEDTNFDIIEKEGENHGR